MGRWVPMAERQGGTVAAVVLSPDFSNDGTAFVATNAGVFRSTDGGRSWEFRSEGLHSFVVQGLALSPSFAKDRTLFAGGADGGVYRSANAGDEWTLLGTPSQGSAVVALAAYTGAEGGVAVLAATLGAGIFASAEEGRQWTARNSGLPDLSAVALAVSPAFAEDGTALVAVASGLYLTSDGGATWREVWSGGAEEGVQVVKFSPAFSTDRTVFAGTEGQGVLRSTDGGVTWQPWRGGLPSPSVNDLGISPGFASDRTLAVATGHGVAVSPDAGELWLTAGAGEEIALSVGISASPGGRGSAQTVLAGLVNAGMLRSEDGGRTWTEANRGLRAASLIGLVLSPGFESDATLFAWGLSEGVLRSRDGGLIWEPTSSGLEEASVAAVVLSPSFVSDGRVYCATTAGLFQSLDRGDSWSLLGLEGQEAGLLALSPAFPKDQTMVAATSQSLHVSGDGGADWSRVELPGAGETPVALTMALDPGEKQTVLLGTWREPHEDLRGRLRIWKRTVSERNWESVYSGYPGTRVAALAVPDSFRRDAKFFIGSGDAVYRLIPDARERTREGVLPLWLPAGVGSKRYPVVSLSAVPDFARTGTLLAATGDGVYVSQDDGRRWQRLGDTPGGRAPIAVAPGPAFATSGESYALTVGGQLWKWDPGA